MRITNWYVITGAPCSGKTTLINELERLGYRVLHEAARAYLDAEITKGKSIAQLKADIRAFERRILRDKLAAEDSLPAVETIFMDRAVPDSIAYYKLEGLCPREPICESRKVRYKKIFFCERLELENDIVRVEDDAKVDRLQHLLKESYEMLGYTLLQVPRGPVNDRMRILLEHI